MKTAIWEISLHLLTASLAVCAPLWAAGGQAAPGYSYGEASGKNEECLACHADRQAVTASAFIEPKLFAHTTHARIGCSACHDALSAEHPDGRKSARTDCRECHPDISTQYAGSIHSANTTCTGCHDPHKVEAPKEISGEQINRICSGCHENLKMTAKHSAWLPQAELHLRMLPCITCHTSSRSYFIDLYIVKGENGARFGRQEVATHRELKDMAPKGSIIALVDANGDNFVSLNELRMFNGRAAKTGLRLRGMMTPETVTHRFEILDSRRNCTFCHASGPSLMQTSYLSLPREDGTFTRVAVERGAVLGALYGTPDFYMMGSTKSSKMNLAGAALVCGGLIMPLGHGFLRFLTRKNRSRKERES